MIKTNKKLKGIKFIDLFCGIGGFRQALSSYGAKCVFSSEWDEAACKVYERNYNEKPYGDITKIDEKDVPEHSILCAGFPCQPFSISGNRKGFEDARGTLFFDIIRIAMCKKPKVMFLENVKNLRGHDGGKTMETILRLIDEAGYDCWWNVLSSSNYGIPQQRERLYFVCFRKDLNVEKFEFPHPKKETKCVIDILDDDEEAISSAIIKRDDIVMFEEKDKVERKNKPIRVGTVNKGGQGERIYSPYGVGITLSAYGGGAGAKTGLYYINNNVRRLTPRECARMQGFPDDFIIDENKNTAYKQFGNSVSIDVLQYIVGSIIETGAV